MSESQPSLAGPSAGQHPAIHTPDAYAVPISSREQSSSKLQTALFVIVFNFCILATSLLQLLVAPFAFHPSTRPYFDRTITYTKMAFGRALLVICQFFGPTKLVLSFADGNGAYLDPHQFVQRDKQSGRIHKVHLPQRAVWMANHQVYTDWLYLWCLAYYSDLADAILIILKKSLKWVPFVGWGMQFYRFIFLARNWAADQRPLARQLGSIASQASQARKQSNAQQENGQFRLAKTAEKLLLLIFPEGTLVSNQTRPLSKKFADKMGYNDLENLLLPRSTGLFFCLRTLGRQVDDLWLVDFAIGYPGIPPAGYGQSYYTLRSVFMQGVPPPAVHVHLVMTRITPASSGPSLNVPAVEQIPSSSTDVPPLGDLSTQDASEADKQKFDEWLRTRWVDKDEVMKRFYRDGDFVGGEFVADPAAHGGKRHVVLPAELRHIREVGDACCWGISILVLWAVCKAYRAIL